MQKVSHKCRTVSSLCIKSNTLFSPCWRAQQEGVKIPWNLEFFHLVTDAHIIPSSHISVPSHTNIPPDTVAETSLNHFACQVVTAQRAYTGLALYKCIHMETAGPLSGSHAIISPYITSFMGPVRKSDETIPDPCQ